MTKNKIKVYIENQEGSGLVLALMVLLVLSVLGASLGVVTIGSLKLSDANRDTNSAYYIAEAGANLAYEAFRKDVEASYAESTTTSDTSFFENIKDKVKKSESPEIPYRTYGKDDTADFEPQFGDTPTAIVSLDPPSPTGIEREYTIKSVGNVGGKERTVEKAVVVKWIAKDVGSSFGFPGRPAIVASGKLELKQKNSVEGDLYLKGKIGEEYRENVNDTDFTMEEEYEKFGEYFKNVENYLTNIKKIEGFGKEELPSSVDREDGWKEIDLTDHTSYKTDKKELSGGKLKFSIGNKDVFLFMAKFKELKKSEIDIIGDGTLTIVMDYAGDVEVKNSKINESQKNLRIVYRAEEEELEIEDGSIVYAQIIAPNSEVEIEDKGSILNGSIIAKEVEIEDGGSLVYKPFVFDGASNSGGGESGAGGEYEITSSPAIEVD